MNPDEFPDTAAQLPPLEADNQLHVLSPEETAPPPTPAQEIGVVDGEFQVYRNPAEGETEGHFETGWTVAKSFDVPVEDGSAIPAVMLEKIFDTGRFDENGEKVFVISKKPIQLEVFRSWQQPHTSEVSDVDALAAGLQGENVFNTDLEVGSLPDIAVVEEIGETAVEESGAVELVITAEPTVDATNVTEALTETNESVDLVAVFASGQSLETALQDHTLAAEVRSQLTTLAEEWKATMSTVATIERVWGADLQPVVRRMAAEASDSVAAMHTFIEQTDRIMKAMDRLGHAREHDQGDAMDERGILQELEYDGSFDVLYDAAARYNDPANLLPSSNILKTAALTSVEEVNHAGRATEMTDRDYAELSAYAQPMVAMGVQISAIRDSIVENNSGKLNLWKDTETLIEETNALAGIATQSQVGSVVQILAHVMGQWRYSPNEVDASTLRVAAKDLSECLLHARLMLVKTGNAADLVSGRQFAE